MGLFVIQLDGSDMRVRVVQSDGAPLLATGSPGGSTIIAATVSMLVNTLDIYSSTASASGNGRCDSLRTCIQQGTPRSSEEYEKVTRMPRVMSQNGATATLEPSFYNDARYVAEARGFNFSTGSFGLIQTVAIVPGVRNYWFSFSKICSDTNELSPLGGRRTGLFCWCM